MSSGAFDDVLYEANDGKFYNARVQPETLTLTLGGLPNTQGAGPVTPGLPSARISGGRRRYGVFMRGVRVEITTSGTSGLDVGSIITLPCLNPEIFEGATKGVVGTYNGANVRVKGQVAEKIS